MMSAPYLKQFFSFPAMLPGTTMPTADTATLVSASFIQRGKPLVHAKPGDIRPGQPYCSVKTNDLILPANFADFLTHGVARVAPGGPTILADASVLVLRPRVRSIAPQFLQYFLQQCAMPAIASAYLSIPDGNLRKSLAHFIAHLPLVLPALPQQLEQLQVLDQCFYAQREVERLQQRNCEQYGQQFSRYVAGRAREGTGWSCARLLDLCDGVTDTTQAASDWQKYQVEDGNAWLLLSHNLRFNRVGLTQCAQVQIPPPGNALPRAQLGDVLLCMNDDRLNVVALRLRDELPCIGPGIRILRNCKIVPGFLAASLLPPPSSAKHASATAAPNPMMDDFMTQPVWFPARDQQQQVLDSCDTIAREGSLLDRLQQCLLDERKKQEAMIFPLANFAAG